MARSLLYSLLISTLWDGCYWLRRIRIPRACARACLAGDRDSLRHSPGRPAVGMRFPTRPTLLRERSRVAVAPRCRGWAGPALGVGEASARLLGSATPTRAHPTAWPGPAPVDGCALR